MVFVRRDKKKMIHKLIVFAMLFIPYCKSTNLHQQSILRSWAINYTSSVEEVLIEPDNLFIMHMHENDKNMYTIELHEANCIKTVCMPVDEANVLTCTFKFIDKDIFEMPLCVLNEGLS